MWLFSYHWTSFQKFGGILYSSEQLRKAVKGAPTVNLHFKVNENQHTENGSECVYQKESVTATQFWNDYVYPVHVFSGKIIRSI